MLGVFRLKEHKDIHSIILNNAKRKKNLSIGSKESTKIVLPEKYETHREHAHPHEITKVTDKVKISNSSLMHIAEGSGEASSAQPDLTNNHTPFLEPTVNTNSPSQLNCSSDCDEDDDDFEKFLEGLRPLDKIQPSDSDEKSIWSTSDESSHSSEGVSFYYRVDNAIRNKEFNFSDNTDSDTCQLDTTSDCRDNSYDLGTAPSNNRTHLYKQFSSEESNTNHRKSSTAPLPIQSNEDFVYSLYPIDFCRTDTRRHPDAERLLPCDLPIVWNSRLLKTSGQCKYLRRTTTLPDGQIILTRLATIELSVKVCTTAERVRDTLLHEACHAATWLIDGVNDGHGPKWRHWANRARRVWPKLPMVTVCHAYTIDTRFTYRCTGCGACVNRHSKSIDITKKHCGRCRSSFELLLNTPRGRMLRPSLAASMDRRLASHCQSHSLPPLSRLTTDTTPISSKQTPAFAEFVRKNYGQVRHQSDVKSHADAMAELGKMFKSCKLIN